MGKSRNKKKYKKNGAASMDISTPTVSDTPQAIDITEVTAKDSVNGVLNRKIKKGVPMKRSKSVRKMKAIKKAISKNEKSEEKITKSEKKMWRTKSAKLLYE
ncbi:hypothetical protein IFM89_001896 [Coptis chinensis]|uniref:Uncharacterized protein n=1 Tax=Coptis chinensis TaxID=261450 RepID=A0A835IIG3_9MAGN|nr:hypothetical protein IFM89_001896 [Coptis chinensis]